jgi:AraC-like DNA-binding protein
MRYDYSYVVRDRHHWTNGVHLSGQADLEAMAVPLRLTCDGDFEATLWTGHTGTMIFLRYAGVAVRAERTPAHLGDILSEYVMLTIVLDGSWSGFQHGRRVEALTGDAMAMRFDQPFVLQPKSAFVDALKIYFPLSHFRAAGVDPDEVTGQSWTLSKLTMSAMDFVTSALDDSSMGDPARAPRLDGMMVRIAMLVLDDFQIDRHGAGTDRDNIRTRVIDLIDTDFRDPFLTSDTVAERLNISARSLFRAFEKSGITVNQLIRQTRLDRAASELAAAGSTKTIAAIAHSHGFRGADTFARAFRLRYHESPSHFRERAEARALRRSS